MISCSEAVSRLWEYVEKDLAPEDAARIDEHVSICRQCCGEAEFAGQLRGFLDQHASAGLPDDARNRLETFLDVLDTST